MNRSTRLRAARGFTLIEVLIALLVIAIALVALVQAVAGQVADFAGLRERSLGTWVADNALTELRLREPWPEAGQREGRERLGGREWQWRITIQPTPGGELRRADAQVLDAEGRNVVSLTAFLGPAP